MTYTLKLTVLGKTTAQPGDEIYPDQWPGQTTLQDSDALDKQYFGGDILRVSTGQVGITTLAIRVTITGRKAQWCYRTNNTNVWRVRAKIEFPQDCDASTFTKGWLYFNS